jgi:hypothetical protein
MAVRPTHLTLVSLLVFSACGGAPPRAESGSIATTATVAIAGRVADSGGAGSLLVFAYTELAPNDDPAAHEPATVGALAADGSFDIVIPASPSVTLVFLADRRHDGVIDAGDHIALLNAPELADLQAGDHVHISDAALDFRSRKVTAAVEVERVDAPARTPTPAP